MPDGDNTNGRGGQGGGGDFTPKVIPLADARMRLEHLQPQSEWPDPDLGVLRFHRRQAPRLPLEIFGDQWASWIEAAGHAASAPVDYVAAALLSSASALIGHARWARAWKGWEEPPHLWCCGVGDSGSGKSPAADTVMKDIVPEIERRMTIDFPDQLKEALRAIEVAKARQERWKAEVRAAENGGSSPPPAPDEPPEPPVRPRLIMTDVSVESVALVIASAAAKGILMNRDEIAGWLLGMSQYHDGARGFWLEAYGGRRWTVDRVKHPLPIIIPRFAVAWHGGIQPDRFAEVMGAPDDGLLARFMWFWPERKRFRKPKETPNVEWAVTAFDRLRMLELATGEFGPLPLMVPLEAAASDHLERFGQLMQEQQETAAGLSNSAIGKARGLVLRLSLVLEYLHWCAEDGYSASPEVIGEHTLLAAIKFVGEYVMPMAERTYGDAACPKMDRSTATLARWIAKAKPEEVHVRDLQRKVRLQGLTKADDIHAACRALVESGWLGQPLKAGQQEKKREAYPVSPRLKEVLP